jgi:Ion channel
MSNFKFKRNRYKIIQGILYLIGLLPPFLFQFNEQFYLSQYVFLLYLILFTLSLFSNKIIGWFCFLIFLRYCVALVVANFALSTDYFIQKIPEMFLLAGFAFLVTLFHNPKAFFSDFGFFKKMSTQEKLKVFLSYIPELLLYFICISIVLNNNYKPLNNRLFGSITVISIFTITYFYQNKIFKSFTDNFYNIIKQINIRNNLFQKISVVFTAYTSLSFIYSLIYTILNRLDNLSFNQENLNWLDAFYFSTITIATVGYGDIFPKSNIAKFFVISEVYFGIVILTIFLSIAISTSLASKGNDSQ